MTFTINFIDGSARRVGDVAGKENQDIIWNGYYIKRQTTYFMGIPISTQDTKIYNRVPDGGTGDRPMVGPLNQSWDYTVYADGWASWSGSVQVRVPAGATVSNYVEVRAWREKVRKPPAVTVASSPSSR